MALDRIEKGASPTFCPVSPLLPPAPHPTRLRPAVHYKIYTRAEPTSLRDGIFRPRKASGEQGR
jgi:hypothetical protein